MPGGGGRPDARGKRGIPLKQRILSVILASVLCLGCLPATAAAAEDGFNITNNTDREDTYTYAGGVLTVKNEADLTISNSGQTSHRIVVEENTEATITLNGVHIVGGSATNEAAPVSAIDIADNASLLLKLADNSTNTLIGGSDNTTSNGVAGIHVPEEAELVILGAGSLSVTGGASSRGYAGSGIGGNAPSGPDARGEACGTVVILATGNVEISGGKGMNEDSHGDDIGGGKGPPQSGGDADDGGGIRPTGNGNYVVWGNPCLPDHPSNYMIPEGATLTIPKDTSLTISTDVTLTNNGIITGDGTMGGPGVLTGSGIVTVFANTFQKDSALTLTIDGAVQAAQTNMYAVAYGSQITLKAEIKQADIRSLSAGDYNTVTFYVGEGESKAELGTVGVQDGKASLPLTLSGDTWNKGFKVNSNNTITAEFSGYSHLKPATGTAILWLSKGPCTDQPDAPSSIEDATATSVTLTPVSSSDDQKNIQYGFPVEENVSPANWQSSTTFENLTPATAYTFYARYAENDFYRPSGSGDNGLKVVTAPAADAVTFNYEEETIAFNADTLEVNSNKEFSNTPLSNNGTVASCIGRKIYVRVKSENDANTPIRGITEIDVPVRPASPKNPKVANVSAAGQQDGKILNLTPNADYQISTDETIWANHTTDANGVISNLAAGIYKVRTKATPTQFAGASASVTIGVGNVITIIPPTFDPVYFGYMTPASKPFTIRNSSDQDVVFGVTINGGGFEFISGGKPPESITVPARGENTYYSLRPKPGLSPGVHTTTITVTYGNGQTVTATVRFTVLPKPTGGDGGDDSEPTYSNRIEKTRGGDVRVSVRTPEEGQKVTITPEPDSGYEVSAVTVTGAGGRAVKVTGHGDGTWSFRQPDERVTIHVAFREIGAALPFTDVPEGAWYYDGVKYAYENGLMAGTDSSAFSPEGAATRGQIVTILWRLAGSPGMEDEIWGYPYADVDANAYYATAVYWARMNGIASGYTSQQFGPNDTITREQLAAMLYRFAGDQGWDTSARADLSRYADAGQVSAWAVEALRWANAEGLIAGTSAATLTPGATATRAQVAVILMRFCENNANT